MMPDKLKELQEQVNAWKQELVQQDHQEVAQDASGGVEDGVGTTDTNEAVEEVVDASTAQEIDLLEFYSKKAAELSKVPETPKTDDRMSEALEMIRALKDEIAELKTKKAVEPVDVEVDREFEEEFPDLAKHVKKAAGAAAAEARREAEALRKQINDMQSKFTATEQQSAVSHHQQVLQKSHSDLAEFFTGGKYAAALGAWAMDKPAEIQGAIGNPLAYSPEYVSFVLSQFKSEVLKPAVAKPEPKKPASGDVAISVKSKATKIEPTNGPAPLTAQELSNIHKMAEKFKHDPAKLKELRERINASYGGR